MIPLEGGGSLPHQWLRPASRSDFAWPSTLFVDCIDVNKSTIRKNMRNMWISFIIFYCMFVQPVEHTEPADDLDDQGEPTLQTVGVQKKRRPPTMSQVHRDGDASYGTFASNRMADTKRMLRNLGVLEQGCTKPNPIAVPKGVAPSCESYKTKADNEGNAVDADQANHELRSPEIESQRSLPNGWHELWSVEHSAPYFWQASTGLVCWQEPPAVSDYVRVKSNDVASLAKVRRRAMQSMPSWNSSTQHPFSKLRVQHPSIFCAIREMAGHAQLFEYLELDHAAEDDDAEKRCLQECWNTLNMSQMQLLSSAYAAYGDRSVEHIVPWLCIEHDFIKRDSGGLGISGWLADNAAAQVRRTLDLRKSRGWLPGGAW
jgi:hypothetical protein